MPGGRHFIGKLTIPKQAGNALFTVEKDEVKGDVEEINSGFAAREGNTFITSSGRRYGFHDDILFPVEGSGIVSITSLQYNVLRQFQVDPQKAFKTLSILVKKGIMSYEEAEVVERLVRDFRLAEQA